MKTYSTSDTVGILSFESVRTVLGVHVAADSAFDRYAKESTKVTEAECPAAWAIHGALDNLQILTRKMLETAIDNVIDDRYYRDLELDMRTALEYALVLGGVKMAVDIERRPMERRNYIEIGIIADRVIDALFLAGKKAVRETMKKAKASKTKKEAAKS